MVFCHSFIDNSTKYKINLRLGLLTRIRRSCEGPLTASGPQTLQNILLTVYCITLTLEVMCYNVFINKTHFQEVASATKNSKQIMPRFMAGQV